MSGAISAIPLASAYPSPDLPAIQLAMVIAVPVSLLFVWLALVYLAARPGGERPRPPLRPQAPPPCVSQAIAAPDAADKDTTGIEPQLTRSARS
jgi:hypothetical protein